MTKIAEKEFKKICADLRAESDIIYKHNPIGSKEETLLWMLLSILISWLSLDEKEIPCFPNEINAETYRSAILFVLENRRAENFAAEIYLQELTEK